jgi:hypothetical protein
LSSNPASSLLNGPKFTLHPKLLTNPTASSAKKPSHSAPLLLLIYDIIFYFGYKIGWIIIDSTA